MEIINASWVKIQTGLYLEPHSFTVSGVTYYNSRLHSEYGYCFYDNCAEVYDNEGNLVPSDEIHPNQRTYMRYLATPQTDIGEINSRYVSVPIESTFEII